MVTIKMTESSAINDFTVSNDVLDAFRLETLTAGDLAVEVQRVFDNLTSKQLETLDEEVAEYLRETEITTNKLKFLQTAMVLSMIDHLDRETVMQSVLENVTFGEGKYLEAFENGNFNADMQVLVLTEQGKKLLAEMSSRKREGTADDYDLLAKHCTETLNPNYRVLAVADEDTNHVF